HDRAADHRAGGGHARTDGLAIDVHRAGAALREPAPELRPGEVEVVAKHVEEGGRWIVELDVPSGAVDLERQPSHRASSPRGRRHGPGVKSPGPSRQPLRRIVRSASSLMSSSTLSTTETRGTRKPKSAKRNAVRARTLTRGPSKLAVAFHVTGRVTSFTVRSPTN